MLNKFVGSERCGTGVTNIIYRKGLETPITTIIVQSMLLRYSALVRKGYITQEKVWLYKSCTLEKG
jgi:hypothetical protein